MPDQMTFVIAGGGQAGAKAAEALREQGFGGRIVLAAEEAIRPHERPLLSKGYLQGKTGREAIFVHSPDRHDNDGTVARHGGHRDPPGRGRGDAGRRQAPGL